MIEGEQGHAGYLRALTAEKLKQCCMANRNVMSVSSKQMSGTGINNGLDLEAVCHLMPCQNTAGTEPVMICK